MASAGMSDGGYRRPAGTRRGATGLTVIGVTVCVMTVICLMGPSHAVPRTGGGLFVAVRPPAPVMVGLTWSVMGLGVVGVVFALWALRSGWEPAPRRLLIAGLVVTALLSVLPIAGSTDVLSYAIYGRMVATGHDPSATTPAQLIHLHDPVAAFAPPAWRHAPSFYGPVANWAFGAAALIGGTAMSRITFVLKLLMAAAFAVTAVLLDRIASTRGTTAPGESSARRRRVHILWTLNPLMLWALVVGGHVDGFATVFVVAGLLLTTDRPPRRWPRPVQVLAAGLLLGTAAAVKAPFVLPGIGLALAWAVRRRWAELAVLTAGAAAALGSAYLAAGGSAVEALAAKTDVFSPINPWRWPLRLIDENLWRTAPMGLIGLVAGLLMAAFLAWRMPAAHPDLPQARPMLVLACAWLITSPLQRPWYDAMIFPLLALMPITPIDELLVLRLGIGGLGFVPGVRVGANRQWPIPWIYGVFMPWIVSVGTLAMVAAVPAALSRPSACTRRS